MMASKKENKTRTDRIPGKRQAYEKAKKRLMNEQPPYCPICGKPLDYRLKAPDPNAPEVDHIIPLSRGGHPSDPANLQIVHRHCNQEKGGKIQSEVRPKENPVVNNKDLPWSINWLAYNGSWPPEDDADEG